jgi:adenosine kinase
MNKIVVSGSLAYDRIMDFQGYFHEHILPEKTHNINVSFQVNGMKERFGGTAGNIAYALTLMGERPMISATIGHDYHRYFEWLDRNKISTDHIKIIGEEPSSSCYIITDRDGNQITGFNAGAMKYPAYLDFNELNPQDTLVIISPGNQEDMLNYSRQCRNRGIGFIFDPGQSLPTWDGQDLVHAIEGSRILISNDYELNLIMNKTGLKREALLKLTGTIIVTKGELGSTVFSVDDEIDIPAVKPGRMVDPTGAGDSFRGGLIRGLVQNLDLDHCARMGAVCASFCLESYGTQEYRFSPEEFSARLTRVLEG